MQPGLKGGLNSVTRENEVGFGGGAAETPGTDLEDQYPPKFPLSACALGLHFPNFGVHPCIPIEVPFACSEQLADHCCGLQKLQQE